MHASRSTEWLLTGSRLVPLSRWLAYTALLLVVPGLLGWILGVHWLVHPLSTFAPARVGGVALIPAAAGAMLALLAGRRKIARVLAVLCVVLSVITIALVMRGVPTPLDGLVLQRQPDGVDVAVGSIPISIGILFLLYAAGMLLLTGARPGEQAALLAGALASSQVALAGVLFLAQLAGLLIDTGLEPLAGSLHGLLAALALGVALLERLPQRESGGHAPPRWLPALVGVSSALVVLVLWQVLVAREQAQVRDRSAITAQAVDRGLQRQYRSIERTLASAAAYLGELRTVDDAMWHAGLRRMVEGTEGLRHILWVDSAGTVLRSTSADTLPSRVLDAVRTHVRSQQLRGETPVRRYSTTLSPGPWPLALWVPVPSAFRGTTAVVGLLDDVALVRPFVNEVARDVWVRVRAADTMLFEVGRTATAGPRFTAPLQIGARALAIDIVEPVDAPHSPLPEVVLALGLTVSMLLTTTLWLHRRIWLQRFEESQRFRTVFDTAFQVQLLLDANGMVLEANRAAGELAAMPPAQLAGVPFWHAPWWDGDADTAERVQERFGRACGGEIQRFEVELTAGRERAVTMDFSLKPLNDSNTGAHRVIAEGRDLTIRKRAEESLREISALTTMGRLAARVAHEINNPLAGIQNAFLLLRGSIPETHPHYRFVGAIEREIARIAAVTRQLYETYRPDQSTATQSSVILAVSDAVSFLEQVNRGRPVHIKMDVSQAPSLVPVPDALLRQTLYNLVQNAVEVSPAHGTVTVCAVQEGESCVLRVADEGPGVPAAIRDRIFDPFFSTKDRTVKTGGMGIGLALVRQSVLAVGGTIAVHDRAGGGTEFEVRLPMTPLDTGALR